MQLSQNNLFLISHFVAFLGNRFLKEKKIYCTLTYIANYTSCLKLNVIKINFVFLMKVVHKNITDIYESKATELILNNK